MLENKIGMNKKTLTFEGKDYTYYCIKSLEENGFGDVSRLPYSMKVLLECALRNYDEKLVTMDHIKRITHWNNDDFKDEIPFIPSRIVLQDFTGVPVVVDLAGMRSKMEEIGGDPNKINPIVPVDLIIDHSVIMDAFGSTDALTTNVNKEFERNTERYQLLKWAQSSFSNFRVFPPSVGIIHQVNLEYLATVATTKTVNNEHMIFPDSLVGTDSHTTMINGIGVLGWGVGGIEAEAGMLGQPLYFLTPDVVGLKLSGKLPENATATDLALTITRLLREEGVVGKFVEYFGEGLNNISVEDRATVANMCPEYGATVGFFPVDTQTLDYLRATGRDEKHIALVESYYKAQGMLRTNDSPEPVFATTIHLDLSTVEPSLSGPKRPQDQIFLKSMKERFLDVITAPLDKNGYNLSESQLNMTSDLDYKDGKKEKLKSGAVAIASITSCTNTSNPYVLIGAGLLAKKAVELGLQKPNYVKTSLAPGSLVVTEYLEKSGLLPYLENLGFYVSGYGCATCIGNSGPLVDEVSEAIKKDDITVAAVLSGNRNFEGRIHPQVKMNYLASPILVVAYALAGTVNIDFDKEPIGFNDKNEGVYLKDIWPNFSDINTIVKEFVKPEIYKDKYNEIFEANDRWNQLEMAKSDIYKWDENSTYIKMPPFFDEMEIHPSVIRDIYNSNILAILGDSVTTDHISPAGSIPEASPAGNHLTAQNISPEFFNSYGARRGTHEVMMRGTFANIRIRNKMIPGVEGGFTNHIPSGEIMPIYDACMKYKESQTPLIVIAGKEYGTGSSRDWAAKGTSLLGVKAVIAESFERIHRSNLVGMGVLPLQFIDSNAESLGLIGNEILTITGIANNLHPNKKLVVNVNRPDGSTFDFEVLARLDSSIDVEYYLNGGILPMMLRNFIGEPIK
ncbi:aconitate hydratase [Natranaerovirga pectinivora]|uniref:Aconitate hydratase n=1 Tax=Natranaerovirga pectinivora TaxID=682400 RepID=A0A4R3MH62_9FIRM|nr:aconitate hydratase AcnA [Natranaerovirga pectinivora]TCT12895.1 aconitate hydratase [Natranaerovirga pectinivora]